MIFRMRDLKSTTIVSGSTTISAYNYGGSDVLYLYHLVSGSTTQTARILIDPEVSEWPTALYTLVSGSTYSGSLLTLENIVSVLGQIDCCNVVLDHTSQTWAQGNRIGVAGVCNWATASTATWTTPGGSPAGNIVGQLYDVEPVQDLQFDLPGSGPLNAGYGYLCHLSGSMETGATSYYLKALSRPYLDVYIDDRLTDDRGCLRAGDSASIVLYDVPSAVDVGDVTMYLSGSSGAYEPDSITRLDDTHLCASYTTLPVSGSYTEAWQLLGTCIYSGSASVYSTAIASHQTDTLEHLSLNMSNMQTSFKSEEIPKLRVRIIEKRRPYTELLGNNVYYTIRNKWRNKTVFPTSQWTLASYDDNGYYFTLPMISFVLNEAHTLHFIIDGIEHPTYYEFVVQ